MILYNHSWLINSFSTKPSSHGSEWVEVMNCFETVLLYMSMSFNHWPTRQQPKVHDGEKEQSQVGLFDWHNTNDFEGKCGCGALQVS